MTTKLVSLSKAVKAVSTNKFAVALMERPNGRYYVHSLRTGQTRLKETDDILDYNLASKVFDMVICEMEGH